MARRRLKYVLLQAIGPPLIVGTFRLLRKTLRIEFRNDDQVVELMRGGARGILAFWHADMVMTLFASVHMYERQVGRGAVLASLSEDGELLARTVQRFGLDAVRGSSSRGARSGLIGLERYVKNGGHAAVAVDGPRGPRHVAKLGVPVIARNTGALIFPFTVRYGRSWRLRSWDRTEIPKPFSHCVATFHEPIAVGPTADRDELERARTRIEEVLLQG